MLYARRASADDNYYYYYNYNCCNNYNNNNNNKATMLYARRASADVQISTQNDLWMPINSSSILCSDVNLITYNHEHTRQLQ